MIMTLAFSLVTGCTQQPPMTSKEAETSDTLSAAVGSSTDIDGNGIADSTEAAVAAPGGVFTWDIKASPYNADASMLLEIIGYGGEGDDNWEVGWMNWLPIYDGNNQLIRFGQVFDDGMYRLSCKASNGDYCDPMDAVDDAADFSWIYQFSECGREKSNWIFAFEGGQPYRPDPSGLGPLLSGSDCE